MAGDDEVVFFENEPPHWAARGLAWLLLLVFAAAVVAAAVIRLPETISSELVLVPVGGTDPIRAARGGVVSAVLVREGQAVPAGEPAFTIRSSTVGDRAAERRSLETQLAGAEAGRTNLRQRHDSERRTDAEEAVRLTRRAAHLRQKLTEHTGQRGVRQERFRRDVEIQQNEIVITQKEIEFRRTQHRVARELADRMERLYREGAISGLEYDNRRLETARLAAELQQLDRTLENARLKLSQIRAEHQSWEIDWKVGVAELEAESREVQSALDKLPLAAGARDADYREQQRRLAEDAAKARIRVSALREELGQSRGSDLRVTAPCAGTVLRLAVRAPAAVVQEGDVLAEVACAGERLQAELHVPGTGAGRITPGHVVRLFYDAFPYQRYGVRYGRVRWVSPASVAVKDQRVFRVLADVEEQAIVTRGESRPLLAGMGGRADVVVGRRSALSYAFEPVRQLREALADRPAR